MSSLTRPKKAKAVNAQVQSELSKGTALFALSRQSLYTNNVKVKKPHPNALPHRINLNPLSSPSLLAPVTTGSPALSASVFFLAGALFFLGFLAWVVAAPLVLAVAPLGALAPPFAACEISHDNQAHTSL